VKAVNSHNSLALLRGHLPAALCEARRLAYVSMLKEMSRAVTEWVSAPLEM
jgi:hypothetical protein